MKKRPIACGDVHRILEREALVNHLMIKSWRRLLVYTTRIDRRAKGTRNTFLSNCIVLQGKQSKVELPWLNKTQVNLPRLVIISVRTSRARSNLNRKHFISMVDWKEERRKRDTEMPRICVVKRGTIKKKIQIDRVEWRKEGPTDNRPGDCS